MARNTRQRESVRQAFLKAGRPLGPREVLDACAAESPGIGMATVYRHLRSLTGEGFIVTVDVPGEPPRYELSGLRHHHHFHCRRCGRVFDVPGCPGHFESLAPRGFRVEDHELMLYGRCGGCARAS